MARSCCITAGLAQSSVLFVLITARDATSRWPAASRRRARRMACESSCVLSSLRLSTALAVTVVLVVVVGRQCVAYLSLSLGCCLRCC